MESIGLPPFLVYHHLYAYLPNNLEHVVLSFDLSDSEGVQAYADDMKALIDRLEHGDLSRCVYLYIALCGVQTFSKVPALCYLSCRSFRSLNRRPALRTK
jgi:hypothetical protein